jgi:hypothetical protein
LLDTSIPKNAAEEHLVSKIKDAGESVIQTNTATIDLSQNRSSETAANLTSPLVQNPSGETELVPEEKPKKFKFPKVAMKFSSNQRIRCYCC